VVAVRLLTFLSLSGLSSLPTAYQPTSSAVVDPLTLAHGCAGVLPELASDNYTRRCAPRAHACTRLRHVPPTARCSGASSSARAPT